MIDKTPDGAIAQVVERFHGMEKFYRTVGRPKSPVYQDFLSSLKLAARQTGQESAVHAFLERAIPRLMIRATGRCWEWDKSNRTPFGYGQIWFQGRQWRAHRLFYFLFVGPIGSDEKILHTCDNPPCVNPVHLRAGTQADNMRDMATKGRGRNQWSSKAAA